MKYPRLSAYRKNIFLASQLIFTFNNNIFKSILRYIPELSLMTYFCPPCYQALSLVEQEKSTLAEKLANTNRDLAAGNLEYDRLKRDALARQEQDRANINEVNNELKNFRAQFEEAT